MKTNGSIRILTLTLLALVAFSSFADDDPAAAGATDVAQMESIPLPPRRPKFDDESDDAQTGAKYISSPKAGCKECGARKSAYRQITKAVEKRKTVTPFKKGRPGKPLNPMCTAIIDGAQAEGPTGFALEKNMKAKYPDEFTDASGLNAVCPGFRNMSSAKRRKAWAWFFMVLANEESDCHPNLVHGTRYADGRILNPHVGWGLWTMEQSSTLRRARGPECEGNIKTIAVQAKCTLSIMAKQLKRFRSVIIGGEYEYSHEYWGPLKSSRFRKQIYPNMMKFPGCVLKRKKT